MIVNGQRIQLPTYEEAVSSNPYKLLCNAASCESLNVDSSNDIAHNLSENNLQVIVEHETMQVEEHLSLPSCEASCDNTIDKSTVQESLQFESNLINDVQPSLTNQSPSINHVNQTAPVDTCSNLSEILPVQPVKKPVQIRDTNASDSLFNLSTFPLAETLPQCLNEYSQPQQNENSGEEINVDDQNNDTISLDIGKIIYALFQ